MRTLLFLRVEILSILTTILTLILINILTFLTISLNIHKLTIIIQQFSTHTLFSNPNLILSTTQIIYRNKISLTQYTNSTYLLQTSLCLNINNSILYYSLSIINTFFIYQIFTRNTLVRIWEIFIQTAVYTNISSRSEMVSAAKIIVNIRTLTLQTFITSIL